MPINNQLTKTGDTVTSKSDLVDTRRLDNKTGINKDGNQVGIAIVTSVVTQGDGCIADIRLVNTQHTYDNCICTSGRVEVGDTVQFEAKSNLPVRILGGNGISTSVTVLAGSLYQMSYASLVG